MNQMDYVLIAKRYRSNKIVVRSYQGADSDTDHFLVICKFRLKLHRASRHFQMISKFNIKEKRQKYITKIKGDPKPKERQEDK